MAAGCNSDILETTFSNLKFFGLSPRKDALSAVAFAFAAVAYIASTYRSVSLFSQANFMGDSFDILANTLFYLNASVDLLLPLLSKNRLDEFLTGLERAAIFSRNQGRPAKKSRFILFMCVLVANYVSIVSQVALYATENTADMVGLLSTLLNYVYGGMGSIRVYAVALAMKHHIVDINRKLVRELRETSFFEDARLKELKEFLRSYDCMLDLVKLYSGLFGLQIFCICLIFDTVVVQNVVLMLNNTKALTPVTVVYLSFRTISLTVSSEILP